jgi:hypothetical protein
MSSFRIEDNRVGIAEFTREDIHALFGSGLASLVYATDSAQSAYEEIALLSLGKRGSGKSRGNTGVRAIKTTHVTHKPLEGNAASKQACRRVQYGYTRHVYITRQNLAPSRRPSHPH